MATSLSVAGELNLRTRRLEQSAGKSGSCCSPGLGSPDNGVVEALPSQTEVVEWGHVGY